MRPKPQREMIVDGLKLLFEPGQTVEVRVLKAGAQRTISGYFTDHAELARALAHLDTREYPGIYYTLQAVNPALLARSPNKLIPYAETTTKDADVERFRWLLIDCDPVRPKGISSTNEEKGLASDVADEVRAFLASKRIASVLADSGNGYHVLVKIDLSASDSAFVRDILNSLSDKFSTHAVEVDKSVFNPSRIVKAYGTTARKGSAMPDRPHRLSHLVDVPANLAVVPRETLEALLPLSEKTASTSPQGASTTSVEEVLTSAGFEFSGPVSYLDGQKWTLRACPFDETHTGTSACVFQTASGAKGFKCLHSSCADKRWREFRQLCEQRAGRKFTFYGPEPTQSIPPIEPTPDVQSPAAEAMPPAPVLPYPIAVWDGTLYGDFAAVMCKDNFVPPEFFVEALKTVIAAIVGDRVRCNRAGGNMRQFTVLIGQPGKGKGTATRSAPEQFIQQDFLRHVGATDPWTHIGAVTANVGSEVGLYQAGKDCPRVLLQPPEFDELIGKSHIENSGLPSILRELFDTTWFSASTTSKRTAKDVPTRVMLSLLTSTQPSTWETALSLHGGLGSGLLSRLTLVSSDESRTVASLPEPQLGDWNDRMFERLTRLERAPALYTVSDRATKLLDAWWHDVQHDPQEDDSEVRTRLIMC